MKRYSNVYESFFDFLKGMSDRDIKDILLRLDKFIAENPEFSFDNKYNLPGVCPIERIAQTIVLSSDKLKKAISVVNKKIEDISIYTLRGKKWSGDVLVLSDSEVSSKNKKIVYRPDLDYFYQQPYPYSRRGRSKSYYDNLKYFYNPNYAYEHNTNEGKFSDFINFLNSGKQTKESNDFNIDLSLFKIFYFLDNNKSYDYDKRSDTPGLIFLSMLSEYTYIPYKELKSIIERGLIPNSELIRFNHKSIDGPIVLFHKPSENREKSYEAIYQEIFQEPFPSDEGDIPAMSLGMPIPPQAQQDLVKIDKDKEAQANKIKNYLQLDPDNPKNKPKGFTIDQIKNPIQIPNKSLAVKDYLESNKMDFFKLVQDNLNFQKESDYINQFKTYLFDAPKTNGRLDNQRKLLIGMVDYLLRKGSPFFDVNKNMENKFFSQNDLSENDIKSLLQDLSIFLVKDSGRSQELLDEMKVLYNKLS